MSYDLKKEVSDFVEFSRKKKKRFKQIYKEFIAGLSARIADEKAPVLKEIKRLQSKVEEIESFECIVKGVFDKVLNSEFGQRQITVIGLVLNEDYHIVDNTDFVEIDNLGLVGKASKVFNYLKSKGLECSIEDRSSEGDSSPVYYMVINL